MKILKSLVIFFHIFLFIIFDLGLILIVRLCSLIYDYYLEKKNSDENCKVMSTDVSYLMENFALENTETIILLFFFVMPILIDEGACSHLHTNVHSCAYHTNFFFSHHTRNTCIILLTHNLQIWFLRSVEIDFQFFISSRYIVVLYYLLTIIIFIYFFFHR